MALFNDKFVGFMITCLLILGNNVKSPQAIRRPSPPHHSRHGLLDVMTRELEKEASSVYSEINEPMANIRKLRKDLMSHYDVFARPIKNASAAISVWIFIPYSEVVKLSELEEKLVLDIVIAMAWKDEHLQWNPKDYSGIVDMIFPEKDIWRPDVIVYNSAPVTENIPWNNTKMLVHYDGNVYWYPPASVSVRCPMPQLKPTEERNCSVIIGSYSYATKELKLEIGEYKDQHVEGGGNPIWEKTNLTSSLTTYDYGTLSYSSADFTITLKRRYDFFGMVVRGPRTVAILLTLSMFLLPSSSDKKLNLGCLVLLVLSAILIYFSSTVVSPSLLAATVAPIRVTLFAAVSAVLIEVIVINLSRLSDIVRPSPILVRILSGMVGRVIGVCPRVEYKEETGMVRLPETEEEESSQASITVEEEWSLVAMALDRVFFIVYSVIFIAIS